MRKAFRWLLKALIAIPVIVITSLAILIAAMWWEHRTTITLPQPTGQFAVGRTMFAWTNDREIDELSPRGTKRLVLVWAWYPVDRSYAGAASEYLPAEWRAALAERQGAFMTRCFKRDPSVVRTHSFSDAPVSAEHAAYPVVLLQGRRERFDD